jgi:SAM-dependent methyltransferase
MKFQERHCVLCGPGVAFREKFPANFTEDDLNETIFAARRMPDRRHFRLVECSGCGMIYSNPGCDITDLAVLYEKAAVTYEKQEEQIYASYATILDRAMKGVERRGTFLEIGGGRGFMLRYGHDHGFARLLEIEPSADAEQRFAPLGKDSQFIRGIFTKGTLPSSSVTFACFFQMLDHTPDPRTFLADVYDCLEPGGVALSVTHNTKALSARVLGERSPIYDIEHTYLFNHHNLPRLFEKVGFEKAEAFPVANNYSLGYWMYLAPLPKAMKRAGTNLLERIGLAKQRINLRAGNIAVVARKPLAATGGQALSKAA